MNRERFRELVNDPRKTREEIEQMRINALNKGEIELAHIAKIALDERFPGWDRSRKRSGGSVPTLARFREEQEWFPSAKEAYVWLMGRFIWDRPDILGGEDWQREFIAKGRSVNYFAKDLKSLFHHSPHLADDPNKYTRLGDGWFADLNLSNRQKFQILCRFAAIAGYGFEKDWDWFVEGTERKPLPF